MNNIILIGMPGSGKSSLGVVLAKKIGFGFIDSDLVIQQREGMTLERIIEKHGDWCQRSGLYLWFEPSGFI